VNEKDSFRGEKARAKKKSGEKGKRARGKPKAEVKGIRAATEICPTQTVRRRLSRL
jgi:hypothetical protein